MRKDGEVLRQASISCSVQEESGLDNKRRTHVDST